MPRSVARLRACWVAQAAVGCAVMPATCRRRVWCSRKIRAYRRCRPMVSMWRKSQVIRQVACAERNSRQVGPARRGAGSIPAARRICQTVEAAIGCPSRASSPWIRRWPHRLFSRARRGTSFLTAVCGGGRPGPRRRREWSHRRATSLRCQANSVLGAMGKTLAQRRRGISEDREANDRRPRVRTVLDLVSGVVARRFRDAGREARPPSRCPAVEAPPGRREDVESPGTEATRSSQYGRSSLRAGRGI